MNNSLSKFLALVPTSEFLTCKVECRVQKEDEDHHPFHDYQQLTFSSADPLVMFLVRNGKSSSEILSLYMDFGKNTRLHLDLLMGRLEIKNGLKLLDVSALEELGIFGSGKLIQEIQIGI